MKRSDYDHFTAMLTAIGELYGKPVSEMTIGIWWGALQHYDIKAVQEALNRHVQNPDSGQFMPKPADVVKMMQGTTQDSAMLAWFKVDRALRTVGTYRDVVFDDPLIHRVIMEMGGWVKLGTKNEDEWPFVAKEFENRYRAYRARNEVPDYPPKLAGIASSQNSLQGLHAAEEPTLIGDQAQAMRVLKGGSDKPILQIGRASDRVPALARIA